MRMNCPCSNKFVALFEHRVSPIQWMIIIFPTSNYILQYMQNLSAVRYINHHTDRFLNCHISIISYPHQYNSIFFDQFFLSYHRVNTSIWGFPKIGVPLVIIHLQMDFPSQKPTSYWGTPMTMETPIEKLPVARNCTRAACGSPGLPSCRMSRWMAWHPVIKPLGKKYG